MPFALGNVSEPTYMPLYVPEHSEGCSSLLKPNPSSILGNIVKTENVPVFSLSHFLDYIPFDQIETIDYLKIDVQGYDINVLKGTGDYLSDKVVYLTIEPEVNQYVNANDNSVDNINLFMEEKGFTKVNHPNTQDPTYLNTNFLHRNHVYIWQHY